ncbi:MAG: hypothetical protein ABR501_10000, partial [Pyrinomonadaceae bacterium]
MKILFLTAITTTLIISGLSACAELPTDSIAPPLVYPWSAPPSKIMRSFRSEQELSNYLKDLAQKQKHRRENMAAQPARSGAANLATSSDSQELSKSGGEKDESVTNV